MSAKVLEEMREMANRKGPIVMRPEIIAHWLQAIEEGKSHPALIFRDYDDEGGVSFDVLKNATLEPGTELYLLPPDCPAEIEKLLHHRHTLAIELMEFYQMYPGTMKWNRAVEILESLGYRFAKVG